MSIHSMSVSPEEVDGGIIRVPKEFLNTFRDYGFGGPRVLAESQMHLFIDPEDSALGPALDAARRCMRQEWEHGSTRHLAVSAKALLRAVEIGRTEAERVRSPVHGFR